MRDTLGYVSDNKPTQITSPKSDNKPPVTRTRVNVNTEKPPGPALMAFDAGALQPGLVSEWA